MNLTHDDKNLEKLKDLEAQEEFIADGWAAICEFTGHARFKYHPKVSAPVMWAREVLRDELRMIEKEIRAIKADIPESKLASRL